MTGGVGSMGPDAHYPSTHITLYNERWTCNVSYVSRVNLPHCYRQLSPPLGQVDELAHCFNSASVNQKYVYFSPDIVADGS